MAKEMSRLSTSETRIMQENARLLKVTQTQIETIETLKQREIELTEILEQLRIKHESEIASFRKAQEELLEERYEWLRQMEELKAERLALTETSDYHKKDIEKREEWMKDDEEIISEMTPERLSLQSPIKGTPSRNVSLEVETIKASFSHAQMTIHGLRNALQREKIEKIELRRLLNEALEKLEKLEKENAKIPKRKTSIRSQYSTMINPYEYKETTNEITIESDSEWRDEHDTSRITINTPDNTKCLRKNSYVEEMRNSGDLEDKISTHTKKTYLDNSDTSQDSDNEINTNKKNRYLCSRKKKEFSFDASQKIQPLFKELQIFSQNNYVETTDTGTMTDEVSDFTKTRNFLFNLNTIIAEKKPASFILNENGILHANDTNSLTNIVSDNPNTIPSMNLSKETNKIDRTNNNIELQSKPFSFSSLVSAFKLKKKKSTQMPSIFEINKNSSNVTLNKLNYNDDLLKDSQLNSKLPDDIKQQEDKSSVILSNSDFNIVLENNRDNFSNSKILFNDQDATLLTSSSKFSENTTDQSLQIESLKSQNRSEFLKKLNTNSGSQMELNKDKYRTLDKTTHMKKTSYEFLLHDPALKKSNKSLSTSTDKETTYGTITVFNSFLASKGSLANNTVKSSSSSFSSKNIENSQSQTNGRRVSTNTQHSIDPQIIRCITQTMIGEYLWKYTRKHARKELSHNRHLRFFWVHPYSRSLYWCKRNPSTSYGQESYAKSAFIESVRAVHDDNNYPQGIHNKSIVVITPTRAIKFTAGVSTSHELWYQALSYLTSRINPLAEISSNTVESIEIKRHNLASKQTADDLDPLFKQSRDSSSTFATSSNKSSSERKTYLQRHASLPKLNQTVQSSINSYSSIKVKKLPSKDHLLPEESHLGEKYKKIDSIMKQTNTDNVRACCNGKHNVGTLSYRSRSFSGESRQSRSSSRGYYSHLNTSINH